LTTHEGSQRNKEWLIIGAVLIVYWVLLELLTG
jgi:hypothetical protein